MAAEVGPSFKWGALLRASKPKRVVLPDGTVKFIEESTDRQDLELIEYIRDNQMGVIVDSYKDVASAWKPGAKRPRYKHALVDLSAGYIDGIACLAVDRLTRRRDQVRPILNAMEEMGGRLFFLWDGLDTASDDPDTELKLHTLVARAEQEAERTSRRYKLAAQHRARRGLHQPSSRRPYGHNTEWNALVPHEAELLTEAAKRIVAGEAVFTVARDFTAREIPTATGKTLWRHSTLRETLLSARMIGKREYEGTLIELPDVPAIMPEHLWRQACEKLGAKYARLGRRESRQLSNLALCSLCGLALIGDSDSNRGNTPTYVCKKRPAEPGACGGTVIYAAALDTQVDGKIVAFLNDRPRVVALLEQNKRGGPKMAAIDTRYAELEDNKLALEDAAFNPPAGVKRLPRERYWELRTAIEQEQEALQRRRVVNREAEPLRAALKQSWTLDEWRAKPIEYRRAIIKLVTERVEVIKPARYGAKKGEKGAKFDPERVRVIFADE
jgi:site-specific DNA recombinase